MSSEKENSPSKLPILQLINLEGSFASGPNVESFFRRVPQNTTNYHTLAVFGGQGTGKSTLLNKLFGTKFQTMREDGGRSQTTRGAFGALIPDSSSASASSSSSKTKKSEDSSSSHLLVIDFEGTDGMERGEDQSFEKKLSLFAVASADVVIVNMFANEVGRFNAANLALLRTVFELNLRLFQNKTAAHKKHQSDSSSVEEKAEKQKHQHQIRKTTLYFVIRDFVSGSLEKNSEVMTSALEKIWEQVAKPDGFRDTTIDDIFTLRFSCLPHYVLQRDRFDCEAELLKSAFLKNATSAEELLLGESATAGEGGEMGETSSSTLSLTASTGIIMNAGASYVFEDSPHCSTGIPLHDNVVYLASVWETIKTQRDLDIPSQRLLVAQIRSQEATEEILGAFSAEILRITQQLDSGIVRRGISQYLEQQMEKHCTEFSDMMQLYVSSSSSSDKNSNDDGDVGDEKSSFVVEALNSLKKRMQSLTSDVFRRVAKCLSSALLRCNEDAVQVIVDGALKKQLPELAEEWLSEIQGVVGGGGGDSSTSSSSEENKDANFSDPMNSNSTSSTAINSSSSFNSSSSRVLSDVRKKKQTEQELAKIDVSRYVKKFWQHVISEIDTVVSDLRSQAEKIAQIPPSSPQKNSFDSLENGTVTIVSDSSVTVETILKEIARAFMNYDSDNNTTNNNNNSHNNSEFHSNFVFNLLSCGLQHRVRSRCRAMTADTVGTLTGVFEKILLHGHDGSVRYFGTKTMLNSAFQKAQASGLLLLACLAVVRGRWYSDEVFSFSVHNSSSPNTSTTNTFEGIPTTTSGSTSPQGMSFLEPSSSGAGGGGGMMMMMNETGNNVNDNDNNPEMKQKLKLQQEEYELTMRTLFTTLMDSFEIRYVMESDINQNNNNVEKNTNSSENTGTTVWCNNLVRDVDYPHQPSSSSSSSSTTTPEQQNTIKIQHIFREHFIIIDEVSFRRIFDLFQQHCKFTWQFQLRQLEMNSQSGGPLWVYGLLAFFVAKEAFYLLRDPVLLILFLLVIYFFCLQWIEAQWNRFLEVGPPSIVLPARAAVATISGFVSNMKKTMGLSNNTRTDSESKKKD